VYSEGGGSDVRLERNSETPVSEEIFVDARVDKARVDSKSGLIQGGGERGGLVLRQVLLVQGDVHHL
jgi:hypothetical protein